MLHAEFVSSHTVPGWLILHSVYFHLKKMIFLDRPNESLLRALPSLMKGEIYFNQGQYKAEMMISAHEYTVEILFHRLGAGQPAFCVRDDNVTLTPL